MNLETGEHRSNLFLEDFQTREDYRIREIPTTVMDGLSYQLTEIPELLDAADTTITEIGSMCLERSFRQPDFSLQEIVARQDAIRELRENQPLKETITNYLVEAKRLEPYLISYLFETYAYGIGDRPNLYDVYKKTRKFIKKLNSDAKLIHADSSYITEQLETLGRLDSSPIYDWINRPVVNTIKGLKSSAATHILEPRIPFRPRDLKPLVYLMLSTPQAAMFTLLSHNQHQPIGLDDIARGVEMGLATSAFMYFMMPYMTRGIDDQVFVKPLGEKYFQDPDLVAAIESYGKLDELLALVTYADTIKGPSVLPQVFESDQHRFSTKKLRNPRQTISNEQYVPNDIVLENCRLTFITGPNSGGKTSLSKTIAQTQILAQIGSYVPAESASISVSDHVFYHAPMINSLQDTEGRFGVEVGRTKDIFMQTTPKSLVFLDELIEATTYEERLEHSYDILNAFWYIGANIVLVTHNHELAQKFMDEGRGQFWQVEFNGKIPTHTITSGISRESHAVDVMERLGFTKEDMENYLHEHGYL